jgi:hypothetical protein
VNQEDRQQEEKLDDDQERIRFEDERVLLKALGPRKTTRFPAMWIRR